MPLPRSRNQRPPEADVGFHIDLLGDVESHFFEFHDVCSLRDFIIT